MTPVTEFHHASDRYHMVATIDFLVHHTVDPGQRIVEDR